MKMVSRGFFIASLIVAIVLLVWAAVSTVMDDPGFTFLSALLLWLATGLPLAMAGGVLNAFRQRSSSMRMPSHLPDWMRDRNGR